MNRLLGLAKVRWEVVRDDPKLPDDDGEIPKSQRRAWGGSIPNCEISSLPDGELAKWSTTSCTLTLACRPFILNTYFFLNQMRRGHKL